MLLLLAACAFAPQTSLGDKVSWLGSHAVKVRSIDPRDRDYSDLQPIAAKIGDARIVVLGENSHSDGATSEAKCRMIRFLHDRMGFDVLAWEGGMLDCEVMNTALRGDGPLYDAKAKLMRGAWATSGRAHDAFAFARETWRTNRPLEMAGFDIGGRPPSGAGHYRDLIRGLFASDPSIAPPADVTAGVETLLARMLVFIDNKYVPRSNEEREMGRAWLSKLVALVMKHRTRLEVLHGKRYVDFAVRCLETLRVDEEAGHYQDRALSKTKPDPNGFLDWNRLRDRQMGDNLLWLLEKRYAGRKIIVWAATAHLIRNSISIDSIQYPGMYQKDHYDQAGEFVYRRVKGGLYTIAFTAGVGKVGTEFPDVKGAASYASPLDKPAVGSFEDACLQTNDPYLFVDLRGEPAGLWPRQKIEARPLGYVRSKADWGGVFDAFFFIRDMTPEESRSRDWLPEKS